MSKINNQKIIKNMEQPKKDPSDSDSDNVINKNSIRSVLRVVKSQITQDGEGVTLNRSFPNNFISEFDPSYSTKLVPQI